MSGRGPVVQGGIPGMLHAKGSPWCFTDGGLPRIPVGGGTLFSQSGGSAAGGVLMPGGPGPAVGGGARIAAGARPPGRPLPAPH